jgi:hypothetical protein
MNDANTLGRRPEIATADKPFFDLVLKHFDAAYYMQTYGDAAAAAGLDPLQHWLSRGSAEGRQISRAVDLRFGEVARRSSSRIWQHYRWRETDIAARVIEPISPNVIAQIINQARHEPAVLAAGADMMPKLSQQDRENVHLDVVGLQRAIPSGTEFLVIVPDLELNEGRQLTADIVAAMGAAGLRSICTIVADQESSRISNALIPDAFRGSQVLFWRDFWIHGPETVRFGQLAQLINVLRPRATIIGNSREGHEMLARYGRALSARTKLYCIGDAATPDSEFAASLPCRALAFATAVTDDVALAAKLREQAGDDVRQRLIVLPRHSSDAFVAAVAALFAPS